MYGGFLIPCQNLIDWKIIPSSTIFDLVETIKVKTRPKKLLTPIVLEKVNVLSKKSERLQ